MRKLFSEKNIIIVLFVSVLISFSLAQEDSRKILDNPANQSTKSAEATFQNSKATLQDSFFRK